MDSFVTKQRELIDVRIFGEFQRLFDELVAIYGSRWMTKLHYLHYATESKQTIFHERHNKPT